MEELPAIHKRQSAHLVLENALSDGLSVFHNALPQNSHLEQP
jgi:hypothetical protein